MSTIDKGVDYYNYPYTDNPAAADLLREDMNQMSAIVHKLAKSEISMLNDIVFACNKSDWRDADGKTPLPVRIGRDHAERVIDRLNAAQRDAARMLRPRR